MTRSTSTLSRALALALLASPALADGPGGTMAPHGTGNIGRSFGGLNYMGGGGGGGYTGPGDVVSGAVAWWGLRAYSAAKAGTKAANICNAGNVVCADVNTLANGTFDVATAQGAPLNCGGSGGTCQILKWYDQSGANACGGQPCDLTPQTGNTVRLAFNIVGGRPMVQPVSATDFYTSAAGATFNQAQPFTVSAVAESTVTADSGLLSGGVQMRYNQLSAGSMILFAGNTTLGVPVSNSAFHAIQAVFNGASSLGYVDGAGTGGSPGTGGFASAFIIPFSISGGQAMTGYAGEIGIWPVAFTAPQQSSMNSNQHTYWGF